MKKTMAGLVLGALATVGLGASALAQEVTAGGTITVEASEVFTVTSPCRELDLVTFTFEGEANPVECEVPEQNLDAPQGFRFPAGNALQDGTASTTFTAPTTAGTYTGTIVISGLVPPSDQQPQGFRAVPARPILQQAAPTFTVIVNQVATTPAPTAAPTTAAPTTAAPTTVAPSTSTGVIAPTTAAPTTTLAASGVLPATGPSRNDNIAVIALVTLLLGGMLVMTTRWRRDAS